MEFYDDSYIILIQFYFSFSDPMLYVISLCVSVFDLPENHWAGFKFTGQKAF